MALLVSCQFSLESPLRKEPVTPEILKKAPKALGEIELEADGEELEDIQCQFQNLPSHYPKTIWRGDMARFILENLNP